MSSIIKLRGRGVSRKAPSVVDRKADKVEEKVN